MSPRRRYNDDDCRRKTMVAAAAAAAAAAARWVTTTAAEIELEVLECPICYRPLKPPVFQCAVGHVVCSLCSAQLPGKNCHTCGVATGLSRCFAVEHIVESVRVPCANAGHGCPAKTAYHGKEEHEKTCPHADIPQGPDPEQGGNGDKGSRGRNLVIGLVLVSIPVAIPVVCSIIKHSSLSDLDLYSCVATVAT